MLWLFGTSKCTCQLQTVIIPDLDQFTEQISHQDLSCGILFAHISIMLKFINVHMEYMIRKLNMVFMIWRTNQQIQRLSRALDVARVIALNRAVGSLNPTLDNSNLFRWLPVSPSTVLRPVIGESQTCQSAGGSQITSLCKNAKVDSSLVCLNPSLMQSLFLAKWPTLRAQTQKQIQWFRGLVSN